MKVTNMIPNPFSKFLIISLLMLTLLSSCAADPRREAEAYATTTEADQRAADETQQRQHAQDLHEQKMQNIEAWQTPYQNAVRKIIETFTTFAPITLFAWLMGAGVAGVWMMLATSKAYSIWAENKANQINLHTATRQYPLYITRLGNNVVALTNPNDNSVLLLNEKNPADRAKIMAMANTQFAGALGHEARLSHRPGEVAQIPAAQIIEHGE